MSPQSWLPQPTGDGSFTLFSDDFGESFYSLQGAKAEAFLKLSHATELLWTIEFFTLVARCLAPDGKLAT